MSAPLLDERTEMVMNVFAERCYRDGLAGTGITVEAGSRTYAANQALRSRILELISNERERCASIPEKWGKAFYEGTLERTNYNALAAAIRTPTNPKGLEK